MLSWEMEGAGGLRSYEGSSEPDPRAVVGSVSWSCRSSAASKRLGGLMERAAVPAADIGGALLLHFAVGSKASGEGGGAEGMVGRCSARGSRGGEVRSGVGGRGGEEGVDG